MNQPEIWTFFYGSYMNLDVLREVDYAPRNYEMARLPGFALTICPLANLVRSEHDMAYGIVATGTHAELERLYDHAEEVLGGRYLPEAVLVETGQGRWIPALCYIAPDLKAKPATTDYIDRIAVAARLHGLPEWYLEHIASFKP